MKKILLSFVLSFLTLSLFAQSLENLTPEQLEMYKKYLGQKNAFSSKPQDNRASERIINNENLKEKPNSLLFPISGDSIDLGSELDYIQFRKWHAEQKGEKELSIFGQELFLNQQLTFEPNLNIPTPPTYTLGTYDELVVDVSGLYEANYLLKISPDGYIRIPAVGMVKVSGLTIESATSTIMNRLSKVYTGIYSGATHVNVSLGNIRSIRVIIAGEATRPGTYTLPSLATAFNALYACGGPNINGSMRNIKVLRKGKTIATIDLYRFLIDGIASENISLQDEDVIKLEPYQKRVSMKGAVKHEAIFEAKDGETLSDLIRFAGGLKETASGRIITAIRNDGNQKKVVDVTSEQTALFKLESGDQFEVSTLYEKFSNQVKIEGAIHRPGIYALDAGMTVKELLQKADGITEEAFLDLASIYRKRDNDKPEVISFHLKKLLDNAISDILLQKNDSLHVGTYADFHIEESVSIWGEVKNPGVYEMNERISVKDLIYMAKGYTEKAFSDTVELVRMIKDYQSLNNSDEKTFVIHVPMNTDFEHANNKNYILKNGDQIIVRSIPGFEDVRMVKVEGEVVRPGSYNILNKTERVSDLLKRTGGITKYAYPVGAYLIRTEKTSGVEGILRRKMVDNAKKQLTDSEDVDKELLDKANVSDIKNIKEIKEAMSGSKSAEELLENEGIVGINLEDIIRTPGSRNDLLLEDGDILYVPRELQTVRVLGEVLFPTYVSYKKGMSLKSYVGNAGGFTDRAKKGKTFVLYANGTAKTTRSFFGIKKYPPVRPGSHIVVPEQPVDFKQKLSTPELVSIMSSIATVAVLIVSALK